MNQPKAVCALSAYQGFMCRSRMLVTLGAERVPLPGRRGRGSLGSAAGRLRPVPGYRDNTYRHSHLNPVWRGRVCTEPRVYWEMRWTVLLAQLGAPGGHPHRKVDRGSGQDQADAGSHGQIWAGPPSASCRQSEAARAKMFSSLRGEPPALPCPS